MNFGHGSSVEIADEFCCLRGVLSVVRSLSRLAEKLAAGLAQIAA